MASCGPQQETDAREWYNSTHITRSYLRQPIVSSEELRMVKLTNTHGGSFTRVLGILLTLFCSDGVVASNRYSAGRTTTDIVVGCCILGVFLIAVAVCILYCRFCTKRKREERKNRRTVIPIEAESPPEAEVGEEIVPRISFIPPSVASTERADIAPSKDETDQEDAKCEKNVSSISSLSTDGKGLSPIEEL